MRLPASSERTPGADTRAASALAWLALAVLGACSSGPKRPVMHPAKPITRDAPAAAPAPAAAASAAPAPAPATRAATAAPAGGTANPTAPGVAAAVSAHPQVSPAARADFDRVVSYMRTGKAVEAELGFKQLSLQYPQFAAPLVNLAILQRNAGHLEQAEETLKSAVAHERGSAVAWSELGATQRMRGQFKDAASSYEQAIAADPHYAPAWRNLGVLSDLYLGDPGRALTAFEQYRQLTGEDKPVSGWIAELRQRLGVPPVKRPAPAAPANGNPGDAPAAAPGAPAAEPRAAPEPQSQPTPGDSVANGSAGGA
ncbi:MAG: tetratricopeptide repeat protein [Gammaproteobacteria bacterium]|nr:MAG: tetratricopeptide repeat protein [Gammaproteobacteria bacterium]